MTPEEIMKLPGWAESQITVQNAVKEITDDFHCRIQLKADEALEVLGYKFLTEKQQLKFWAKRVLRVVDKTDGVNHLFLDYHDKKKWVLLCRFDPKTLIVE